MQETGVQFLGQEEPLEKEMAIHFSVLAWKIPRTEETGGLQSMGLQELDTTERLSLTSLTYFDVSPLQFCYEYLSNFIAHLSVYLKYL